MFEIFREEKIITVCILSFFVLSIGMQFLLGILYQKMIQEVENMATTNHKILKQCKLKFANCYQLNNGVPNISVFVDKFLSRLALGPISFEGIYHLSGQTMLLSVVSAGAGICKSIMNGRRTGEILPFYIVSFLGLYLYFSISTMLDVKGRKRNLKVSLVDYLENHLSSRINVTEEDMEMLYGRRLYEPGRGRRGMNIKSGMKRTVEFTPISNKAVLLQEETSLVEDSEQERMAMERELEELLQEFLAT